MTKADMINQVATDTGLTKAASKKVIDIILQHVLKTLKKKGRVTLYGFGIFEVVKRKKRMARNPRTSEPVPIKAHKAVKFKSAKALKEMLN